MLFKINGIFFFSKSQQKTVIVLLYLDFRFLVIPNDFSSKSRKTYFVTKIQKIICHLRKKN